MKNNKKIVLVALLLTFALALSLLAACAPKVTLKNLFLQVVISKELDITFCIIRAQRLREINQQNLSQQKNNGGDLNKYAAAKRQKNRSSYD